MKATLVAHRDPPPAGPSPIRAERNVSARAPLPHTPPESRSGGAGESHGRSRALVWRGRTYAFGGAWLTFRRPERRVLRSALRNAGATHWAKMPGNGATHVGAFRLQGERGSIACAVDAARVYFGNDFAGAFEISTDSLPRAWWVVAVADEAVLLDTVFEDLDEAKAAFRDLSVPGREFTTRIAPPGFGSDGSREAGLDEFLELADLAVRPIGHRRISALAAVALLCAGAGGLAAAQWRIDAEPAQAASAEAQLPQLPLVAELRPLGVACEAAVASALDRHVAGWKLDSASCDGSAAQLVFAGSGGDAIRSRYPGVYLAEGDDRAIAGIALDAPLRALAPPDLDVAGPERLVEILDLLGRASPPRRSHLATELHPYDSYRFQLRSRETMPTLLQAFSGMPNLEWTGVGFDAAALQWSVEGRLHVSPR